MTETEHTHPSPQQDSGGLPTSVFEDCKDDEGLIAIVQTTAELLGVQDVRVCVARGERVYTLASVGLEECPKENIHQTLCRCVVAEGAAVTCSDVTLHPDLKHLEPAKNGTKFFAGAPILIDDGTMVGVLSVRDDQPRDLSPKELRGVDRMARLAATMIQRKLADYAASRSASAFEGVFDAALAGMILISPHRDATGQIVDMRLDRVNDAALEILGIPREGFEGELHKVALPASRENGIVEQYIEVYKSGIPSRQEFFYADSRLRGWYDVTAVKTQDGVALTFLDVTKRIENELATSEQRRTLELFVKHTPAAVAVFDRKMRYLIASDRWIEDYQLASTSLVGKSHYDIFPEIGDDWKQIHQRCLAGEVITRGEECFIRSDGREEWIEWAIHPWRDSSGAIGGIIIFSELITEKRKANEALRESQQNLSLALESGNIAMWDVNTATMQIRCSDHWFAMLGLEPQEFEVTREHWNKLIHPDDRSRADQEADRMISGKSDQFRVQYRIHSAEIGYIWVESIGRVVEWDEDGVPVRSIGVMLDISARRESEEIIHASERRLNLALECANAGLWDWNVQADQFVFSTIWWMQLGYDPDNPPYPASFEGWEQLAHPDDLPGTVQALNDHFTGKTPIYSHEFRMKAHDGEYRWFRGIGKVVERTPDGDPVRMLGINLDIHDQHEAQEAVERFAAEVAEAKSILEEQAAELADNNRDLEEARGLAVAASRAKTEFLANMSHEIRTPMTAILGYAELLSEPSLDPIDRATHTDTIIRNGQHLLSVINDILDISRIEAGKMSTERISCSPADIVAGVQVLLEPRAQSKGITLSVEWDGQVPERCHTDPTRLRQILLNLAGNAIKFTSEGGVTIRIGLETAQHGSPKLYFDVIDTGIGIAEDRTKSLFTPFSQTDASHTRRFGGTGLGLSISARLASLLGGSVRLLKSTPNQGSTFRATIDPGPIELTPLATPKPLAATQPKQPADHVAKLDGRILIAEDGPDNQRLLRHHLDKAGAYVEAVGDGQEAVSTAQAATEAGEPFDLILMDMQMPVMDGLTATATLRKSGYTRPIVALTAHAMDIQRKRCLDGGCDDHLAKPISRKDLVDACQRWVEVGKTHSA